MLYGTGMTADDMNKAQVGIGSEWYDGNTCNMHLNQLADKVKEGVQSGWFGWHEVQHDWRKRWHIHGH